MATTQIRQRQIADGAVADQQVQSGAAIATSKLADGSNFIKKDGSVAMTGSLDSGNQTIVNVATPSGGTDAANKNYVDTQITSVSTLFTNKGTARVSSTANVTVSNPGTSTFDGVSVSSGDRILLKNQSTAAENGIYVFNGSSSAMTRAADMDVWSEVPGAWLSVQEGTTNADTLWLSTANAGGTLGSTSITFTQIQTTGYTNSNFVDKETPSGSVNGSNTAFVLANTPTSSSEHVYLNGVLQESGSGNDYTISSATITMATAPLTGERIKVSYRK